MSTMTNNKAVLTCLTSNPSGTSAMANHLGQVMADGVFRKLTGF
jgi:hypothetical protein